jgi:hypothetical protein
VRIPLSTNYTFPSAGHSSSPTVPSAGHSASANIPDVALEDISVGPNLQGLDQIKQELTRRMMLQRMCFKPGIGSHLTAKQLNVHVDSCENKAKACQEASYSRRVYNNPGYSTFPMGQALPVVRLSLPQLPPFQLGQILIISLSRALLPLWLRSPNFTPIP